MNRFRLIIGVALGLLVTLGLFILMPALIETADRALDESEKRRIADILMPEREITENVKEEKPEPPPDPDQPPPDMPEPDMDTPDVDPGALNLSPRMAVEAQIAGASGLGGSDGEYLPIVKVAPVYPRRAQSRGVEGYCIVEYTVTRSGAVQDPEPIDCQPRGYFENASINAALKFKYKPRVVDGEAIDVAGVRNKFTYELEQ